jgi:F0F1-type ATP synthase assembly protein I
MVKPLRIFNSWGLLVICILILGLGYDILIVVEIAKRVVYDEQHKKPQGAGELLGLF